jgi:hypothetical protein
MAIDDGFNLTAYHASGTNFPLVSRLRVDKAFFSERMYRNSTETISSDEL